MRSLTAIVALSLAVCTTTPAWAQDSVGIAICDEFLNKYETCANDKVPAAQRGAILDSIKAMRSGWKQIITSSPQSKGDLEATCRQTMDAMKPALASSYGCTL